MLKELMKHYQVLKESNRLIIYFESAHFISKNQRSVFITVRSLDIMGMNEERSWLILQRRKSILSIKIILHLFFPDLSIFKLYP